MLIALFSPNLMADEWVKGLFTHKEHTADLSKPIVIDSIRDKYTLVEGKKVQESNKAKTTYVASKKLLREGTADAEKISKGDFCKLNTEMPYLSGYNITDIVYVIPCEKKRIPKYKLR